MCFRHQDMAVSIWYNFSQHPLLYLEWKSPSREIVNTYEARRYKYLKISVDKFLGPVLFWKLCLNAVWKIYMPAQNQTKTTMQKRGQTIAWKSEKHLQVLNDYVCCESKVFFLLHMTAFVSSVIIKNVCMCDQKLFNGEMLKDSKRRVIGSFVKISHSATCWGCFCLMQMRKDS